MRDIGKLRNIALILIFFSGITFVGEHRRLTEVSRTVCSDLLCISAGHRACCARGRTCSTTPSPVCDNMGIEISAPARTGTARASSCRPDTCICYRTWDTDIAVVRLLVAASSRSRYTNRDRRCYWIRTRAERWSPRSCRNSATRS